MLLQICYEWKNEKITKSFDGITLLQGFRPWCDLMDKNKRVEAVPTFQPIHWFKVFMIKQIDISCFERKLRVKWNKNQNEFTERELSDNLIHSDLFSRAFNLCVQPVKREDLGRVLLEFLNISLFPAIPIVEDCVEELHQAIAQLQKYVDDHNRRLNLKNDTVKSNQKHVILLLMKLIEETDVINNPIELTYYKKEEVEWFSRELESVKRWMEVTLEAEIKSEISDNRFKFLNELFNPYKTAIGNVGDILRNWRERSLFRFKKYSKNSIREKLYAVQEAKESVVKAKQERQVSLDRKMVINALIEAAKSSFRGVPSHNLLGTYPELFVLDGAKPSTLEENIEYLIIKNETIFDKHQNFCMEIVKKCKTLSPPERKATDTKARGLRRSMTLPNRLSGTINSLNRPDFEKFEQFLSDFWKTSVPSHFLEMTELLISELSSDFKDNVDSIEKIYIRHFYVAIHRPILEVYQRFYRDRLENTSCLTFEDLKMEESDVVKEIFNEMEFSDDEDSCSTTKPRNEFYDYPDTAVDAMRLEEIKMNIPCEKPPYFNSQYKKKLGKVYESLLQASSCPIPELAMEHLKAAFESYRQVLKLSKINGDTIPDALVILLLNIDSSMLLDLALQILKTRRRVRRGLENEAFYKKLESEEIQEFMKVCPHLKDIKLNGKEYGYYVTDRSAFWEETLYLAVSEVRFCCRRYVGGWFGYPFIYEKTTGTRRPFNWGRVDATNEERQETNEHKLETIAEIVEETYEKTQGTQKGDLSYDEFQADRIGIYIGIWDCLYVSKSKLCPDPCNRPDICRKPNTESNIPCRSYVSDKMKLKVKKYFDIDKSDHIYRKTAHLYGKDYYCQCKPGYSWQTERKQCVKKNRCVSREIVCRNGGTCFESDDGFTCLCTGAFKGPFCRINRNPCNSPKVSIYELGCIEFSNCKRDPQNSLGYWCLCPKGYEHSEENNNINIWKRNPRCYDINECKKNIHKCNEGSTCINTRGSYRCICPPGVVGIYCQNNIAKDKIGFFGNIHLKHDCSKSCGISYRVYQQSCLCRNEETGKIATCYTPSYCLVNPIPNGYNYSIELVGKDNRPVLILEKYEKCEIPECKENYCSDEDGKLVPCQTRKNDAKEGEVIPSFYQDDDILPNKNDDDIWKKPEPCQYDDYNPGCKNVETDYRFKEYDENFASILYINSSILLFTVAVVITLTQ
ncbi:DgyrCDS737 [Dimorphilus gyrociliatus]|uniref:DgyrCDS737 n=1 Tax=Dimorphilus gyrociliatus TaxID=2664684 RepID=A0A7I8V5H0_9ANNE|nr:DgyrCDS737 [Dimorphilus gyrociliatus]